MAFASWGTESSACAGLVGPQQWAVRELSSVWRRRPVLRPRLGLIPVSSRARLPGSCRSCACPATDGGPPFLPMTVKGNKAASKTDSADNRRQTSRQISGKIFDRTPEINYNRLVRVSCGRFFRSFAACLRGALQRGDLLGRSRRGRRPELEIHARRAVIRHSRPAAGHLLCGGRGIESASSSDDRQEVVS